MNGINNLGSAIIYMLAGIGFMHLMQILGIVGGVITPSEAAMIREQGYEDSIGLGSYPYDKNGNVKERAKK